ncbi:DUF2490 domain-containing protein [Tamlana sp. 2201CG12-4]|uniref:DUF2490 domain-containing protein n=1 Tax=Tamlana sp. 2201CG12-4 TaxID=3112582 RepID=UPI002DBAFCF3|nr:DUF2490 domain-containing protein [Tamlana sp. 2201CG12-4]MEC3906588.1 DUF2490 domain-containing protein [Tamlana sp. 2201CG12-4]
MNMRCIKIFLIIPILLFLTLKTKAQNNFNTIGESAVAFNYAISNDFSINFTARSRYVLYNKEDLQFLQQQVDFFHFSTLKLSYNHKISLGVYYRNRDLFETGRNEVRFLEQFNYIKQTLGVRYGHRFRAEQRIIDNETTFRQRYRFAVDFPLNGENWMLEKPI